MTTSFPSAESTVPALQRLARRRAQAKLGWYGHALVYLLVNAGLMALAVHQGRDWFLGPLLGWGLGLALHGASVWLFGPASTLRERMEARELARMQARARAPR